MNSYKNMATAEVPLFQALAVVQQLNVMVYQSEWSAVLGREAQSQDLEGLPSMPLEYRWTPT